MDNSKYNKAFKLDNPDYWKIYYGEHKNELLNKQREYRKNKKLEKREKRINDMLNNMNTLNKQIYSKTVLKKYNIVNIDGVFVVSN